jgi:hypothetical protein
MGHSNAEEEMGQDWANEDKAAIGKSVKDWVNKDKAAAGEDDGNPNQVPNV